MATAPMKKEEPASPEPMSSDEEDIYEDAGDLEFYDKTQPTNEQIYSARLPDYLWKKWASVVERMQDDEQIQLGTLRTWEETDKDGNRNSVSDAPRVRACAVADFLVTEAAHAAQRQHPRAPGSAEGV